jgi:hypothetical protein
MSYGIVFAEEIPDGGLAEDDDTSERSLVSFRKELARLRVLFPCLFQFGGRADNGQCCISVTCNYRLPGASDDWHDNADSHDAGANRLEVLCHQSRDSFVAGATRLRASGRNHDRIWTE